MNGRRTIATGVNAAASLLDGLATPWLILAVNPFFLRWMWLVVSPAGASRAAAIFTASWLISGFMLLPAIRHATRYARPDIVWIAVVLAAPLGRFFMVWGSGRYSSFGLFVLLERACTWTIYLGETGRQGKLFARLRQYSPWFVGVIVGWGIMRNAVNWFEKDAGAYIVLSGLIGTAAALLKITGRLVVRTDGLTDSGKAADERVDTNGIETPVTHGQKIWVPLVLIYALLLVAASLPKELIYLSPSFERDLVYWGMFGAAMLAAGFTVLVVVPEDWLRMAPLAAVFLLLLAGLPSPARLVLLGGGFGTLAACLFEWKPGFRISLIWSIGLVFLFAEISVFYLNITYSPWLRTGVALSAVIALFAAWRQVRSLPGQPDSGEIPGDT